MNTYMVSGRLAKDIELTTAKSGNTFTRFAIACESGIGEHRKTFWLNCVMFGKRAELFSKCFHKGDNVVVSGELNIDNQDEKTYVTLTVSDFAFPTRRSKESATEQSTFEDLTEEAGGDLPF